MGDPARIIIDSTNEEQLILAAQRNSADFAPLYQKNFEAVFRFVYQRLDDRDMAYDITTNVFIKALSNIRRYEFRGIPFLSWLYRIGQNELNMAFRAKKAERTVNLEDHHLEEIIEEIDEGLGHEQYMDRVIEALDKIEMDELQIIEMRFFEGRPFKEIGEILDITENNAKVKCYRILEKMKKMIIG